MAFQRKVSWTMLGIAVDLAILSLGLCLVSSGNHAIGAEIQAEHSQPQETQSSQIIPYQSDSYIREIVGKKTGFFHVEQQGDTWWVIDPMGRGFVPLGVDHASFQGHWCEKLGYAPYGRKNEAKYANADVWSGETLDRLKAWGFNLLGAGCSQPLKHRGLAHTEFLSMGTKMAGMGDAMNILPDRGIPCSAFPNVFHPGFEKFCRDCVGQQCLPHVGDPWLFGYFLDNELAWWGTSNPDTGLFDAVMGKSADHSAKAALRDFLAQRYEGDIHRLNQAWGLKLDSFDNILDRDSLTGPRTEAVLDDKKAFAALIADRYFSTITQAIRAVDPDHMILGSRFAGGICSEGVWQAAGRHCDIVTFNYYGNVDLVEGIARDHYHCRRGKPLVEEFQKFYDMGRRPMMVTEWSFPAIDAGLPSMHGAGQRFRTQAERTKATEITARTMLSMPFLVGYDYFMWVDEPALGISTIFPEDSNYGLVSEDGRPYELLTTMFANVHREAGRLRREGVNQADMMVSAAPPPLSRLAQLLEQQPPAPTEGAAPHPQLRFERRGEEFTAGNGPLVILGRIGEGGLTREIQHRGMVLGQFNGMIQQFDMKNEWIDVKRLTDAQAAIGPTAMTLDLIGAYEAPSESGSRSFELAYRLTLLPERDWFVAQLLWCRNTDTRPMDLRGVFFRIYSQIGGSAENDTAASVQSVPRLWGAIEGDAWLDAKAGAFWGLVVGDADLLKIAFRRDENGQQYPDAVFELERRLAPGETYRPATPVGVLSVAGRGDRLQWEAQAKKTLE